MNNKSDKLFKLVFGIWIVVMTLEVILNFYYLVTF